MSSSEDKPDVISNNSSESSPTNPFVAFRRFADSSISSLLDVVLGSNPLNSSPNSRIRNFKTEYESWLRGSAESKARLAGQAEEAENVMNLHNRLRSTTPEEPAAQQPQRAHVVSTGCPYVTQEAEQLSYQERKDLDSFLRSSYNQGIPGHPSSYSTGSESNHPLMPSTCRPSIPIHYLLYSKYSPLHLEQEDPSIAYRTGWRAAFEDLIYIQNGHGLSRYPDEACDSAEAPSEWIKNMINLTFAKRRQSEEAYAARLERMREMGCQIGDTVTDGDDFSSDDSSRENDQIVNLANAIARARLLAIAGEKVSHRLQYEDSEETGEDSDDDDADEGRSTEADLYESLGGSKQSSPINAKSRILAHLRQDASHDGTTESDKPNLLSTLTTTEKTTLEDGTTHTKMVLKKRFSDGREESTETVHTQNALPRDAARSEINEPVQRRLKDSKDKKGWFWS